MIKVNDGCRDDPAPKEASWVGRADRDSARGRERAGEWAGVARGVGASLPAVLHEDAVAVGEAARGRVERESHEWVGVEPERGGHAERRLRREDELYAAPRVGGQVRRLPAQRGLVHRADEQRYREEAEVLQRGDDAVCGAERLAVDDVGDAGPDDRGEYGVAEAQPEEQHLGGQRGEPQQEVHEQAGQGREQAERCPAAAVVDQVAEHGREHGAHEEGLGHDPVGVALRARPCEAKGAARASRVRAVGAWWLEGACGGLVDP
mmetsp:Transcript_31200/g.73690  ORF Transcript_31200/g.73690 Transcript_31200/m.73690 type:complete len:263 (-) Transcript_31200:966-1754(-)